jgi:predicted AAA+ superfamily ATPase
MIVDDVPAWKTALRDSATLRKSAKRHLVDPSLAAGAMGATPAKLLSEPKTLGLLIESLVIRDLRIYAAANRGTVYHYRDSFDREIDAIIEYPDGWIAAEIKMGIGAVDKAAAQLKRIVSSIDTQTIGPPSALLVITGTGPGYRRPDGVHVVPIGALRE